MPAANTARARVLAGYRNLTRARRDLFKGDAFAYQESGRQLREQFEINKNVPTSGPAFEALLQGMDEATHMLRHEIVRGDLNEDTGRYEVKIKREHVQGSAEDDSIKPQVEPITQDTVRRMENPGQVEVCKSSSKKN